MTDNKVKLTRLEDADHNCDAILKIDPSNMDVLYLKAIISDLKEGILNNEAE